jgi:hypothetical protein
MVKPLYCGSKGNIMVSKQNIIQSFFVDTNDYIDFLVSKTQVIIASNSEEYFAELKKEKDCFLYTLTYVRNGKYIGDYVKPFRGTPKNIDTFNNGCKILAERLLIYLETRNISAVPCTPPAFGALTHYKNQTS